MSKLRKFYKDTINGFECAAFDKTNAFRLIQARCFLEGVKEPTLDEIVEIPPTKFPEENGLSHQTTTTQP